MGLLETPRAEIGGLAQDFNLLGVDGQMYALAQVKKNALLVMFICNHCPYVKAIIKRLINDIKELQEAGVGVVAIMPNDVMSYPEDSYGKMKEFAEEYKFTFPYLIDSDQLVAKNYGAVCTPDFFGFNSHLALQYRGRLDNKDERNLKRELVPAMLQIMHTGKFEGIQYPSMGCSIKWKANG